MNVDLEYLRKLPVAEKLRIVELLWDEIAAADEPLVIRDWHREEARRRDAELDANPDIAITREQMWKQVNEPNG